MTATQIPASKCIICEEDFFNPKNKRSLNPRRKDSKLPIEFYYYVAKILDCDVHQVTPGGEFSSCSLCSRDFAKIKRLVTIDAEKVNILNNLISNKKTSFTSKLSVEQDVVKRSNFELTESHVISVNKRGINLKSVTCQRSEISINDLGSKFRRIKPKENTGHVKNNHGNTNNHGNNNSHGLSFTYKIFSPDNTWDESYHESNYRNVNSVESSRSEKTSDNYNHDLKPSRMPIIQMRDHKSIYREKTCLVCGKVFSHWLHKHIKKHIRKKTHKCDVCGKLFSSTSCQEKHMRIHSGEKPYNCDVCSKMFNVNGNLQAHMRIHTGEKPYKCEVCGKMFNQGCTLKKHTRIHTGEKPYKCGVCGKVCTQE